MRGSSCVDYRRRCHSRSPSDGSGNHRNLQHHLFTSVPNGDHLGLNAIGERVRGLGGTAWFERRRGGGVKLRVEVPPRTIGSVSRGESRAEVAYAAGKRGLLDPSTR